MRRWGLAVGVLLALALAGCGAGQTAATAQNLPSVAGVAAEDGGIAVRNAVVPFAPEAYPAGADAPVRLAVFNEDRREVRLATLASDAAGTVTVATVTRAGQSDPAGDELVLAPGGWATVVLTLAGLTTDVTAASLVSVTLSFDNGAVLPLRVSMEPAPDAGPRGDPVDIGHH